MMREDYPYRLVFRGSYNQTVLLDANSGQFRIQWEISNHYSTESKGQK